MRKKTLAISLASGVLAAGFVLASGPAHAAIDFGSATWNVGGISYEFEESGSDAYMGSLQYMTTATQSNYTAYYANEFYIDNGDVTSSYPMCYSADATEETDAATGDVTVRCAPAKYDSSYELYASGETRFYSDTPMARNVWTFENRGTTDIDLGDGTYLYEYLQEYDKGATTTDPTACTAITTDDNWTLQSGLSDTMILGFAWQAKDADAYSPSGACTDDYYYLYLNDTVIPAGKTVHFMAFQYSAAPSGSSTGDMDAAYASLLPAMDMFNALDAKLCRGIEGKTVYGWGTCPGPVLPDTGVSPVQAGLLATGAGVLALAGVALVVIRRRANA